MKLISSTIATVFFASCLAMTSAQTTVPGLTTDVFLEDGNGNDTPCAAEEVDIKITLTFDNNPDDTDIGYSYLQGNTTTRVSLKKPNVNYVNKVTSFHACWPKNTIYGIYITDDDRDGLQIPGEADIRMNGLQVLKSPDNIGNYFGSALVVGDGPCASGSIRFNLELFFDFFPFELTWEVKNKDNNNIIVSSADTLPLDATEYPRGFSVETLFFDQCLTPGNYEFTIFDSEEDGIFQPGYYRLFLNRRQFKNGRRSFDKGESTQFSIEGPTPPPTPAPPSTPAPTGINGPTDAPFETIIIAPGALCFSGHSTVTTPLGPMQMKDLKVGDEILAKDNQFERVYSFGHKDVTRRAEFLQLMPSKVELSRDHMIFVQGKGAIPASMIKTGDVLSDGSPVETIRQVVRTGVYTPYTPSGTIQVNGVLASNYISLQNSDKLMVGSITTPFTHHWLDHTFQVPHRIWCHYFGFSDSNLDNGFSTWSEPPFRFCQWLLQQTPLVMGLLLVPFVAMLGLFIGLEAAFAYPVMTGAVVLSTVYMRRNTSTVKSL